MHESPQHAGVITAPHPAWPERTALFLLNPDLDETRSPLRRALAVAARHGLTTLTITPREN